MRQQSPECGLALSWREPHDASPVLERELAKRGVTKLVSIVSWTNLASLKSCWRLGYISLGNMTTIGGKSHAIGFYPKAAKALGVRFGRKAVRPK